MAPWRPKTTILWLREVPSPIPVQAVRQRLPDDCDAFVERDAAPVGDETRIYQALDLVADVLADGPVDRAFLMGDGHVLQAVKDTLEAAGVGPEAIRVENFFNAPKRA
jgi:ferredoxin-NADP reductase